MGRSSKVQIVLASDVPYVRSLLRQQVTRLGMQASIATSAAEALRLVGREPCQLLVADLANPPGASEQLLLQLRIARYRFPILLLLPEVDRDLFRRLANLGPVGFLRKPLDMASFDELLPLAVRSDSTLLRRSAELSQLIALPLAGGGAAAALAQPTAAALDPERLQRMMGNLPMMPHVVARVVQLQDSDEDIVQQLSETISGDPRLAGQLLRMVNSAYFGFARRIATIPEATVILGTEAIRNLALGAACASFFGGRNDVLDKMLMWRHSLAVAAASRAVADLAGLPHRDEAFTAGLLHDFGRLALETYFRSGCLEAMRLAREEGHPLLEAEQAAIGFNHAWVGGYMAQQWHLPPTLMDPIAWHHHPEGASEASRDRAAAVNLGDALCHLAGLEGVAEVTPAVPNSYAIHMLNIDWEQAVELVPQIVNDTRLLEAQLATAAP